MPSSDNDCRQKSQSGLLKAPLPLLSDPEGQYLPASLPFMVDAHVHLFPDYLFRIIFGTDFPNLPYAWDREIKHLIELKLPDTALERILGKNAMEFYAIN
jgi:predicted TIM-barrel fold metal-dependent hydrolase